VAVSVADLVNYYADAPPPKNDSLADLEARLEALVSPATGVPQAQVVPYLPLWLERLARTPPLPTS
jgi:hypothetical protein